MLALEISYVPVEISLGARIVVADALASMANTALFGDREAWYYLPHFTLFIRDTGTHEISHTAVVEFCSELFADSRR